MDTIETSIYTAVAISCIIFAIVILYFGFTIVRRQRKYYATQKAHFLAEIELLNKERSRIASDLHDDLGPLLTIARIEISEIAAADEESLDLRNKAHKHIVEITDRLGEIARNLAPRRLLQKGLDVALDDFFKQYQDVTPIKLYYQYKVKQSISVVLRTQVYTMVKEIVHNAGKHSGASLLQVTLQDRKDLLYIYCKDDGVGMALPAQAEEVKTIRRAMQDTSHQRQDTGRGKSHAGEKHYRVGSGMGLESLKNRVEMLGGKIQINTNGGTEYFIEIPLKD